MDLHLRVLNTITDCQGTSESDLCLRFGLTQYRLHRAFRRIRRDLEGTALVNDSRHGVWLIRMDPDMCTGTIWMGPPDSTFVQCNRSPEFPDGCCYDHSCCEGPEMAAFERTLGHLVGPGDPTVYSLGQLTISLLEELVGRLAGIQPITGGGQVRKDELGAMLAAALKYLRWKESMRRRRTGDWIPPEFAQRHRRSSGNSFEFGIRKHFLVLEISGEATREEVLKAWRRLARRFHPDAEHGDEERMKLINLAKERIFSIRGWE